MSKQLSIFTTSFAGGGAERALVNLANKFAEDGIAVDLVVTHAKGPYQEQVSSKVRIVDLAAPRIIAALPALIRYFHQEQPTTMLSALNSTNCLAIWAKSISQCKTRLVISEQNTPSISIRNASQKRVRILPYLMKLSYPLADCVVATSAGVADDLASLVQMPRQHIQIIHNPLALADIKHKSQEPLLHRWFTAGSPPVLLAVGRLTEQKDFPTLIKAFNQVRNQRHVRLIILGEGEKRNELEALIDNLGLAEDIDLPGFQRNPFTYMAQASVFVMSSRWEGFGNVLVEAMACGTPVIATNCPHGPSEILEEGKWGRLVPVGDVLQFAKAIEDTLDGAQIDPRQRSKEFTIERIARKYEQALFP